jgi:alpha-D-ribose 1-methylphosphonate 5-phosphate C-P lyase
MVAEAIMIELTEQQVMAPNDPQAAPPRVVNPRTKETFVLLRADEYERLKEHEYDDSPWTRDEFEALAEQNAEPTEWETC